MMTNDRYLALDSEERRGTFEQMCLEQGIDLDEMAGRVEAKERERRRTWTHIDEMVSTAARHDEAADLDRLAEFQQLWRGTATGVELGHLTSLPPGGERSRSQDDPWMGNYFIGASAMKRSSRHNLPREIDYMRARESERFQRRAR